MKQGPWLVVSLCALCCWGSACDLGVPAFRGARIALTLANLPATLPGEHLELWAREGDTNIVRLNVGPGVAYTIAPIVSFADPCAIDDQGNLLWTPAAQRDCFGRPCADDAERQRASEAVTLRMRQLIEFQTPLLVFTEWDDAATGRPVFPAGEEPTAAERLAQCRAYWERSPSAYSGNPFQLTAPIHGTFLGTLDFVSTTETGQIAGGIQLDTEYSLRDVRELWLTETAARVVDVNPDEIDCQARPTTCRGSILVQGNRQAVGRETVHFELAAPQGAQGSGSATVFTTLGEDPVPF
jgi:hypothetical protein